MRRQYGYQSTGVSPVTACPHEIDRQDPLSPPTLTSKPHEADTRPDRAIREHPNAMVLDRHTQAAWNAFDVSLPSNFSPSPLLPSTLRWPSL